MTERMGLINQYVCAKCGGTITTLNRNEGTTPMIIRCLITDGCNGTMLSSFYQVDQMLKPDYEFYKPKKLPKGEMREHVKMGGLLLRKSEQ